MPENTIWQDLARAVALVLIIEGMWPFMSPTRWRNVLLRVTTLNDRSLRTMGLLSIGFGLLVLQFV